jgi:hypothetical protein
MYVLRVVLKQNNETDGALPQNRKIQWRMFPDMVKRRRIE